MADDLTTTTTVSTIPSSTVIATDQVAGGQHYQRIKLTDGTADSITHMKVTTSAAAAADGGAVVRPVPGLMDSGGTDMTDTTNHALKVNVVAGAGTSVTENETVARNATGVTETASVTYAADGTAPSTNPRKIVYSYSNALAKTEKAANGTPTWGQATVDATTVNGVTIIASNANRRRVTITNLGTTDVWLAGGNITAASATTGDLLVGIKGSQKTFYTTAAIHGTVAAGTQAVSFFEEVLG